MFSLERSGPLGFAERLSTAPASAGREAVRRGCEALAAARRAEAAQWFARARRLAPDDAAAHYLLAAALAGSAPEQALTLLADLLERVPRHRDARVSRIAMLHRLGRHNAAAGELDALLCRFAAPAAPGFAGLADAVCAAVGSFWVGVGGDGRVRAPSGAVLRLGPQHLAPPPDGAAYRLPSDWRRRGGMLVAAGRVLGARIDLARIARVEGAVVRAQDGRLTGWAMAPADPDTPPLIEVFEAAALAVGGAPLTSVVATDATLAGHGAAVAYGFCLDIKKPPPGTVLHVLAQNGRPLSGSPVRAPARPRRARAAVPGATAASSWADARRHSAVVLVTHAAGGGVERCVAARAAQLQAEGARAIVVRPGVGCEPPPIAAARASDWQQPDRLAAPSGFSVYDGVGTAPPLRVASVEALADLLRADRPVAVELHHVAAHDPTVLRLPGLLRVPFDVVVHDFAAICPRVTLCGGAARYCGEPDDPHDCEDCVADHGARIPFAGSVAGHRAGQAMLLCAARRVVVPSRDAADRLRRFIPCLAPVVTPWEDDRALAQAVRRPALAPGATVIVAVVGAIGIDKGFSVVLACARDAARRELPLRFIVVGHTIDDERLMATGRCFVTGRFAEGEAPALLAEFAPALGFLPSVWPETWCFALSALWQARLHVLAFDIGAPAERIAATRAGSLLPFGSDAAAINDRCLALARPFAAAQPTRPRLIRAGRRAHG